MMLNIVGTHIFVSLEGIFLVLVPRIGCGIGKNGASTTNGQYEDACHIGFVHSNSTCWGREKFRDRIYFRLMSKIHSSLQQNCHKKD
jgi:hypothetical protein